MARSRRDVRRNRDVQPNRDVRQNGNRQPEGDRRGEADRGSATLWVLAAGMLTVFVALAASAVGAAIVARHRAQAAADLAALGGAALAVQGEQAACARAATLVADNGGGIVSCHLDGWDLMVAAEVVPSGVAAFAGAARASARAGPVADTMPTPVASGQPHQAGRVRLTDRVSAGPAPPRSTSFPPRQVRFVTAETLAS